MNPARSIGLVALAALPALAQEGPTPVASALAAH